MKKQNPLSVFLLTLITFGIYGIVWLARTRGEMVRRGADIPTTFLIIVPIANLYYLWKWSQGVEHVTNGKMQWAIAFLLQWALGSIGSAVIQDSFNKVGEGAMSMPSGGAPMAQGQGMPMAATAPAAAPGMGGMPPADSTQSSQSPTSPQTPPTQLVQ